MPRGRPKSAIDYEIVEKLGEIMCTQEEIASILGVSTRTLQRDAEFCRIYKKAMDNGRASLRRKQYELAMSGNPTMQVWLGKNLLGQTDKQELEHKGGIDVKVKWE